MAVVPYPNRAAGKRDSKKQKTKKEKSLFNFSFILFFFIFFIGTESLYVALAVLELAM